MPAPIVSDRLWSRIEPLLPRPKVRNRHRQYAGRKPSPPRKTLTGIVFVLRTGVPWEHLPATSEWPSGHTCLRCLRKWQRAGVWQKLLVSLLGELARKGKIDWERAIVDSASVRAPHGGRKTGPNPTDRRKCGSKHHLIVDAQGVPLAIILTKANRNDITQLLGLVDAIPALPGKKGLSRKRPKRVQGDRAYDSEPHRQGLKKRGFNRC
jgi:transposase